MSLDQSDWEQSWAVEQTATADGDFVDDAIGRPVIGKQALETSFRWDDGEVYLVELPTPNDKQAILLVRARTKE